MVVITENTSRRPAAKISTFAQKNGHTSMHAAATVMACISFFAAAAILNMVVKKLSLQTHLAGGECWIIQKKQQETSSTMDSGTLGNHLGDCASQGAMAAIICQDKTRVNTQQERKGYYNKFSVVILQRDVGGRAGVCHK
jgi:hypothetical protein